MTEKELQRKYLQLQLLKQQAAALLEEKNAIDERIIEIKTTMNALDEVSKVKRGEEIWSPLGSGSFIRSDIKDKEKVLVSIGAGVVVEKDRTKAIEILHARSIEMTNISKELMAEINKYNDQINKLEPELQELIQKEQEKNQSKQSK